MSDAPQLPTTDAARQTFSQKSDEYAVARPQYPEALYRWLADNSPGHDAAWDCATGNGQAAVGMAAYFTRVLATDISAEQVAHGIPRANIQYSVGAVENSGFPDHAFDLITVAQALHWFDYTSFWPEIRRVAKQDALFCAWGYDWLDTTPAVSQGLVTPFREIIAPFWAPNNKLLWDGYQSQDIAFPFERIAVPLFRIELHWTLGQLTSYMMTWSAYKRCRGDAAAATAIDALVERSRGLVAADALLPISMTLRTVAGRVNPAGKAG
jgi:hypothetical protein